jgi:hypothetical protein
MKTGGASRTASSNRGPSTGATMRTRSVVQIIAAALLITGLRIGVAEADDQIRAGKWEFSVLVPGVTQIPTGMENQPGVRLGPDGMTMSRTGCISADDPLPPMARGPSTPHDPNHPCKVDQTDVSGDTVRWSWSCTTDKATVQSAGVAHYHGETLDGALTTRTSTAGHPPIEKSQSLTGRYLGPCDDK